MKIHESAIPELSDNNRLYEYVVGTKQYYIQQRVVTQGIHPVKRLNKYVFFHCINGRRHRITIRDKKSECTSDLYKIEIQGASPEAVYLDFENKQGPRERCNFEFSESTGIEWARGFIPSQKRVEQINLTLNYTMDNKVVSINNIERVLKEQGLTIVRDTAAINTLIKSVNSTPNDDHEIALSILMNHVIEYLTATDDLAAQALKDWFA